MADESTIEVALFPIPNMVAFPGTIVPLHVFEPRYRKLVNDCVEEGRLLGVSHTQKTISQQRKNQTLEEALNSNQATYKAQEVFSAGTCAITETLPDGRLLAEIEMTTRVRAVGELQSLPYRIVECERLDDELAGDSAEADELQRFVNDKLIELVGGQNPEVARILGSPAWTEMAPADYSFKIFQFLRFDADVMQDVLEMQSANERLGLVWGVLQGAR